MGKRLSKKKICFLAASSIFPVVAISTAVPLTILNNSNEYGSSQNIDNSKGGNFKYLYNGKYYSSTDDIVNELINKNKPISQDIYYGDINSAIFDQETKRLDISKLRKYDPSKLKSAYIDAQGNYQLDYDKAKKSFVNPGLMQYYYMDNLGHMFDSESEAIESNKENIKVDDVTYYEVKDKDNNIYKINPFNKKDISKFLYIAIDNAINNVDKYSLSYFTNDGNDNFGINSILSSILNEKDNDRFIDRLSENIKFSLWNEFFSKLPIFEFKLVFSGKQANNYEFQDKTDKQVLDLIDKKIEPWIEFKGKEGILFHNFRMNDIEILNHFLNREKFFDNSSKDIWEVNKKIHHGAGILKWDVAEEAEINITIGNNTFKTFLNYFGDDNGQGIGVDIGILENGVQDGMVSFVISTEWTEKKVKENLQNNLSNFDSNNFLEKILIKTLNQFGFEIDNDLLDEESTNTKNVFLDLISNIIKKNFSSSFLGDEGIVANLLEKCIGYFYDRNSSGELSGYFDIERVFSNYISEIDIFCGNTLDESREDIINIIKNNNSSMMLMYSDYPVFMFNMNFQFSEENYIDKKAIRERLISPLKLISDNIFNNWENLFKFNYIKNVSNYVKQKEFFTLNSQPVIQIDKENKIIIPDYINEFVPSLNSQQSSGSVKYQNGLWYSAYSYNLNLANLMKRNNNSSFENNLEMKNKFLDLNNALILRNDEGLFENTHFAKYLSLEKDFNESISNIEDKLKYDKISLDQAKSKANKIKPSKVFILYNSAGEIMNPGIVLDENYVINTTNDALYDSKKNLLDNIIRSIIISKSEDKVFYENEDNTYNLIDYKTNFIFKLDIENKTFYFSTFLDAKNYLLESIKKDIIKIGD